MLESKRVWKTDYNDIRDVSSCSNYEPVAASLVGLKRVSWRSKASSAPKVNSVSLLQCVCACVCVCEMSDEKVHNNARES